MTHTPIDDLNCPCPAAQLCICLRAVPACCALCLLALLFANFLQQAEIPERETKVAKSQRPNSRLQSPISRKDSPPHQMVQGTRMLQHAQGSPPQHCFKSGGGSTECSAPGWLRRSCQMACCQCSRGRARSHPSQDPEGDSDSLPSAQCPVP